MTVHTYDDVIGKSATDFIAPESRKLVMEKMLSDYEKPYDAVAIRKDGSKFDIEIHGRTIDYKEKKIRIVAIRDISERKENGKRLNALSKKEHKTHINYLKICFFGQVHKEV